MKGFPRLLNWVLIISAVVNSGYSPQDQAPSPSHTLKAIQQRPQRVKNKLLSLQYTFPPLLFLFNEKTREYSAGQLSPAHYLHIYILTSKKV